MRIGGQSRSAPVGWAALDELIGPSLARLLSEPEVQESLRAAAGAGADLSRELEGKAPRRAVRLLASDRELQARLAQGARALGDAGLALASARKAERRRARVQIVLAAVGLVALAGLAAVAILHRRGPGGGSKAMAEAADAAKSNGGVEVDPVRPAGNPG